jgi:voltage-gated potassium channel
MGYAIIAVPTGIITNEFSRAYKARISNKKISTEVCPQCLKEGHDDDAEYCKYCGNELNPLIAN